MAYSRLAINKADTKRPSETLNIGASDGLFGGKVGGIIYKTDFTFLRLSLRQIILRALWSDQKRYTKC